MNDKRTILTDEEPKHKKKSKGNGLPRSKHKHEYETVLLHRYYSFPDLQTGKDKIHEQRNPTRVCTICGRIDYVDDDPSYYTVKPIAKTRFRVFGKELSEKALNLPKWQVEEPYGKFAVKMEE
jgi:hypothetical protein